MCEPSGSPCDLASSADPVRPDRPSCSVCRRLALRLLFRVAVLPNKLHAHAGHLFPKFLRSGQWFFHVKQ